MVYFFYTVWIAPYFPQKRRTGKASDFSKKTVAKKDPTTQAANETDPTATSTTVYNAEWIPAHHINRPEARKVKGSSRSKTRA